MMLPTFRWAPLALAVGVAGCTSTGTVADRPATDRPRTDPAMADATGPRLSDYDVRELAYPSVRDVSLPDIERVELDNGLVVFLVEDRSLPLIEVTATVKAGSVFDPAAEAGLAAVAASSMRTGGAGARTPDEVNLALENVGATVEVFAGAEQTTAVASGLSDVFVSDVLPVFADVLMAPGFDAEQVDLVKTQQRTAIASRNDDAQGIATREMLQLLYGEDSPYARDIEYATLDAIDRADVLAFHERYVTPNATLMAVSGDFDASEMAATLRSTFGQWKRGAAVQAPPAPTFQSGPGLYFIPKDDVNQSTILIGHPGEIRLDSPDYPAVRVMNEVLGGGFASRLFQTVRTDLGLAYAVFGQYGADYDSPGVFYSGTFTKSESTVQAAQAMREVIESMRTTPPTAEELALAKDSYLNSFVFNFDTKDEVLRRVLTYERYGYPADFLQTLKDRIEDVTAADVQRVAQRYLTPDQAKVLVLGRAADFDESLTALGTATTIDISIPTGADASDEPAGDAVAGAQALRRAAEALGGAARFAAITAYETTSETAVSQGPMAGATVSGTTLVELPGRVRSVQTTPFGEITVVLNDGRGLLMLPGGQSQPAPAQVVSSVGDQLFLDLPYLMARLGDLEAEALEPMDGMARVRVRAAGLSQPVTLVLDASGRPVRATTTQVGPTGPVQAVVEFSDYRDVDGLTLPFKTVQSVDGEVAQTATVQAYNLAPTVAADAFDVE